MPRNNTSGTVGVHYTWSMLIHGFQHGKIKKLSLVYPFENGNKFIFQQFLSFAAPPNPSIIIGAETPMPSGGFRPFSKGYSKREGQLSCRQIMARSLRMLY